MQLTSFIIFRRRDLISLFGFLCLATIGHSNDVVAESITYSPDQWPRHWNVLMHKTNSQGRLNGNRTNNNYSSQPPRRSPVWGVVPAAKQKPRRSLRPEYNTNSHMRNYYGQNSYQRNYYSGFPAYGLATPYTSSMISPYGIPMLAPGLAAPGVPFGAYPFMGGAPMMGGMPGMGYGW